MDVLYWSALVATGLAAGLINTLASSGSAVSLPVLVLLNIPEVAANATNRLPVLIGGMMATWSFHRERQVDWYASARLLPPAIAGSLIGALAAEHVDDRRMGLLITGAVLIALLMLFTKVKQALSQIQQQPPQVKPFALFLMFLIGLWLGFMVLDGATYVLLVLMLGCHYALPQANALKALILVVTTIVPVAMFSVAGDILWTEGAVMSVGSIAGAHLGARFSNHVRAREWVFRLLVAVILLELGHLAWHYTAPLRAGFAG